MSGRERGERGDRLLAAEGPEVDGELSGGLGGRGVPRCPARGHHQAPFLVPSGGASARHLPTHTPRVPRKMGPKMGIPKKLGSKGHKKAGQKKEPGRHLRGGLEGSRSRGLPQ